MTRSNDPPPQTTSTHLVDVYPYRFNAEAQLELLLLKRATNTSYAGSWRMVGGKVRPGETAWQAALRELHEETALMPHHFWTVPSVNHFYDWEDDCIHLIPAFAAEVNGAPVLNHEHSTSAWMPIAEAEARLDWPEQKRLIRLVADLATASIPKELLIPVDAL